MRLMIARAFAHQDFAARGWDAVARLSSSVGIANYLFAVTLGCAAQCHPERLADAGISVSEPIRAWLGGARAILRALSL